MSPFRRLLSALAATGIAVWGLVMVVVWFRAFVELLTGEARDYRVLVLAPVLVAGAWLWTRHFGRAARDGVTPPKAW